MGWFVFDRSEQGTRVTVNSMDANWSALEEGISVDDRLAPISLSSSRALA